MSEYENAKANMNTREWEEGVMAAYHAADKHIVYPNHTVDVLITEPQEKKFKVDWNPGPEGGVG